MPSAMAGRGIDISAGRRPRPLTLFAQTAVQSVGPLGVAIEVMLWQTQENGCAPYLGCTDPNWV